MGGNNNALTMEQCKEVWTWVAKAEGERRTGYLGGRYPYRRVRTDLQWGADLEKGVRTELERWGEWPVLQ